MGTDSTATNQMIMAHEQTGQELLALLKANATVATPSDEDASEPDTRPLLTNFEHQAEKNGKKVEGLYVDQIRDRLYEITGG